MGEDKLLFMIKIYKKIAQYLKRTFDIENFFHNICKCVHETPKRQNTESLCDKI